MTTLLRPLFAEMLGSFLLVFCGTGAVIIDEVTGGAVSHAGVAITFGLTVATVIYGLGSISGAHINPAATIALWMAGHCMGRRVLPYLSGQLCGGVAASYLLHQLFPGSDLLGATLPAGSDMQSFILEIVLTFFLLLVVLLMLRGAKELHHLIGAAAGGIVLLEAMFAGPISGASMNPMRSLAPALVAGHMESIWVYLIAPLVGALLAVAAAHLLHPQPVRHEDRPLQ